MSSTAFILSLASAGVAAVLSGYFSYRMGKSAELNKYEQDVEKRLRNLEGAMIEIQTIIRLRREHERKDHEVRDSF